MTPLPAALACAVLVLLAACSSDEDRPQQRIPRGPGEVEGDVVESHARQFDVELAERPAGSQQEFAAASYITGHLQQAGYVVKLDAVPVEDLVRSSNVVALPPGAEEPVVIVTVGYDTVPGMERQGHAIGTFLEVARALRVRVPAHPVEFVALGAQNTEQEGGALGARRLIKQLQDDGLGPEVVRIADPPFEDPDPFGTAGFGGASLDGSAAHLGRRLLEFLVERSR